MLFTFPFRSFLYLFVVLFSSVLDKDPSGLKVLANKTNSEVSKPLVAVEKSHHHHVSDQLPPLTQHANGYKEPKIQFIDQEMTNCKPFSFLMGIYGNIFIFILIYFSTRI